MTSVIDSLASVETSLDLATRTESRKYDARAPAESQGTSTDSK